MIIRWLRDEYTAIAPEQDSLRNLQGDFWWGLFRAFISGLCMAP